MEMELEPRVKTLNYKVKATSRESPSQKAGHVLETDLRSHWSTATNTKEWILLELDEPCLLSHIRVYNKSVLEWEITVGLRYKPETFVKVRPRCEAPRRDVVYPMNYTPCRYVRISCLRGNPIAIFFVQLIGISVAALEPEFQPLVNHLLPSIIAHKQDAHDMHLQLLQDITSRLLVFLPHLEADLTCFQDSPEDSLRFLAMLAGPLYPMLHLVNEREAVRSPLNVSDSEAPKHSQPSSSLTVSSNFEPRRSRSSSSIGSSTSGSLVFRPEFIFLLLRKAYKESDLARVCRMVSRVLHKFEQPTEVQNASAAAAEVTCALDGLFCGPGSLVDYSALFGEEFHIPEDQWDLSLLNVLDIAAVEEGIFHALFACASQSLLCHKLADSSSDFWSALPLIQALLPALRPSLSSPGDHADNSFSRWKQPVVQQALSQIVATSCSPVYRPLLHACSGYLSSFSISHAKAACILIDLCSSILAPWVGQVIAKVDLAMELMEDLLGTILDARHSPARARAALKYIILALSGQMDDVLSKYKEVKHKILFLLEMLEPFLDPAIHALKKTISFGGVSLRFMEKQEQACAVALNVIRTAVRKPAVLPSIESEWRHGSVSPSVLLSVLEPHMQLPPEIDLCKCPTSKDLEDNSPVIRHIGTSSRSNNLDELNGKTDVSDSGGKVDVSDDANFLFAPPELQTIVLGNASRSPKEYNSESNPESDMKYIVEKSISHLFPNSLQLLDSKFSAEYFSLQADYLRLINYRDSEMKASEFKRLAMDLHSQDEIAIETHNAAIDALLLAADCYVNPFFVMSSGLSSQIIDSANVNKTASAKSYGCSDIRNGSERIARKLETVALVERERDKVVLQLVLEAAELDRKFQCGMSEGQLPQCTDGDDEQVVRLSSLDMQIADAITLVRQNQSLLFNFLIQHLKSDQNSMHEILMHCLVFLLHTATRLYCAPEDVIDIILESAEHLNRSLTSICPQLKEGNFNLGPEKLYGMQRRWMLLHKLVVASTGGEGSDCAIGTENKFRSGNLIPQSAWMQRVPIFSVNAFPLVRYLGWMAISRIAKLYTKEHFCLASDLHNLTNLLSIYLDELALVDNIGERKNQEGKNQLPGLQRDSPLLNEYDDAEKQHLGLSFHVTFPVLSKFLPDLKEQFQYFGESILEAVGLLLRSLSSGFLPDILRWFSDLCSWPFFQDHQISSPNKYGHVKGYAAKNAKAIILYILEAIVVEHMEAMVPEIPRVVQVLVVLCRSPFCDVPFLQSVMHLLKPIISYSLLKLPDEEKITENDSCLNFESLCFEELFIDIRMKNDDQNLSLKDYKRASTIFILANVFADLSFQRRIEILQSLTLWVDFTTFEPTTSFYDYLSAFHAVIESCKVLLVQALEVFGAIPLQSSNSSDLDRLSDCDYSPITYESSSWFLNEVCSDSCPQLHEKMNCNEAASRQKEYLSADEIFDCFGVLENVIIKLHPTIESCWNLHPQLVKNLTIASAQCFVYSKCISSIGSYIQHSEESMEDRLLRVKSADQFSSHWTIALGGLVEIILKLQEAHCWEVASLLLDCLLATPHCFQLDNVIVSLCSSIKNFACSAPKIAWRLQVDKWLSILLARGVHCVQDSDVPLTDLFIMLLCHSEPEQRFLALQQLGRLVGQDINCEISVQMSTFCNKLLSPTSYLSVPKSFLSLLVSRTWDQVVLMASSDVILALRVPAMALLMGYIPYVARQQLQSFLAVSDGILYALGKRTADGASEGPILMLSLALIAVACLYSPAEDFSLIPQEVWRNIEIIGSYRTGKFGDLEKNVCQALCKLQNEDEEAKQVLKETLSSSSKKQADPDFGSTRESILQVLPNLTAVYSYFDMFSKKIDDDAMKLQEAEIELDILLKEDAKCEPKGASGERLNIFSTDSTKNEERLQQIKDQIQSLEKSKLEEEIVARRQKKLLLRRSRQKYLEEAALREEELLRDLDRERMDQAEKGIERQRLLEIERAKTKELRHQLDIEKEKQTQRELQRELEQAESSLRSSRREFPASTHPSRPRDRYRERENGRAGAESAGRAVSGSLQPELPSTSSTMAVPVVLSSGRQFSGQPLTILQPRERQDEFASSYEETLDGSKDSGDTGSVGDPESVSVFDGQSSGFGSLQRQGPRGGKSRQIMERKEREGRREGKWERKNT